MTERWQSADALVRLLAGRWTLALLAELAEGGRRYHELHEALEGISHKVLTDALRHAERNGLVDRRLDPVSIQTAALYQLTDLGHSLELPLAVLDGWVEAQWHQVEEARHRWDIRSSRQR